MKKCSMQKIWMIIVACVVFLIIIIIVLTKVKNNVSDVSYVTEVLISKYDETNFELSTKEKYTCLEEDNSIYSDTEELSVPVNNTLITEDIVVTTATELENYEDEIYNMTNSGTETIYDDFNTSEHQHEFVTNIRYIEHPEEKHFEDVCVSEGYEEEIYKTYQNYCYYCGAVMDEWNFNQILDHSAIHGSYGSYTMLVDVVWHEPVYERKEIIDKQAHIEEVIEEQCVECGYIK